MGSHESQDIITELLRGNPRELYRPGQHMAVTLLFNALCVLPAIVSQVLGRAPGAWLQWWPAACLLVGLTVCMATDYSRRRVLTRLVFVLVCMILYFAIALPVYELLGYGVMNVQALDPGVAEIVWAMLRGAAASWLLAMGLRRSSLMTEWATRAEKGKSTSH